MNERTKRIRIRVCIDELGNWNSAGWSSGMSEAEFDDVIDDGFEPDGRHRRYVWIVADVPLPDLTSVEVQGSVEQ